MVKLIMTKGLPGSGKSTWAKEYQKTTDIGAKRINKDDLRKMLHDSHFTAAKERFILGVRDILIKEALSKGFNVIVDDTNLHPKHEIQLKNLAKECNATFEVNDSFLSVPLEECIKRDLLRDRSVGQEVITSMFEKFVKTPPTPVFNNSDLPKAVIFDIDGTLAHMDGRGPFDWSRVGEDTIDNHLKELVCMYQSKGYNIIFCSGRDAICREQTSEWLFSHGFENYELLMRAEGDVRKDFEVKKEILMDKILPNYYVHCVYDDRDQVVNMWRNAGLKCFQVAPGNF